MSNLACNFTNIIVLSPEGSCCLEQGGPSVLQPSGDQVSSSDAQPALDPAFTSANPLSLPDADQPEAPEEPPVKRRGPNKYICHICGVVKPRKPDLTGHLWFTHKQGDPIVCDTPMYWPKFQYQSISEKTHRKPA